MSRLVIRGTEELAARTITPLVNARDRAWIAEANAWAKAMVHEYFTQSTGLHTVADVLLWLDERKDAPQAWVRWLGQYQTRYGMVRNACVSLARDGYLDTSEFQNSKGRDAIAYTYTGATAAYTVDVHPRTEAARVTGMVRAWLHSQREHLAGVESINITLRKQSATNGTPTRTSSGNPNVRRRIARGTGNS